MENIKICFTGCSSVGKTTLINALASCYPEFNVQRESVRYLKDNYGMDFRSGNIGLQLALLHLQTKFLMKPGKYLLDRSSLDSYAYTFFYKSHHQCDIPASVLTYLREESEYNMRNFVDLIIFLRPGDFKAVEDGIRITETTYRKETDAAMEKLIKEWGLEDKIIEPHGTVEERIDFCKPYIDKLINQ